MKKTALRSPGPMRSADIAPYRTHVFANQTDALVTAGHESPVESPDTLTAPVREHCLIDERSVSLQAMGAVDPSPIFAIRCTHRCARR